MDIFKSPKMNNKTKSAQASCKSTQVLNIQQW